MKKILYLSIFLTIIHQTYAQYNSFLGALGGGENYTQTFVAGTYSNTNWTGQNNYGGISLINNPSFARTGFKHYDANGGSTQGGNSSPLLILPSTSTNKWVLQFYYMNISPCLGGVSGSCPPLVTINVFRGSDINNNGVNANNIEIGSSAGYQYNKVDQHGTWIKAVIKSTSVASANAVKLSVSGRGGGYNGTYIDDMAIYESPDGNEDTNAPDPILNLTVTSNVTCPYSANDITWEIPQTGIDGGGYMVVKYIATPTINDQPNKNGVYGTNNLISSGISSLTGKVIYYGTNTNFTDTDCIAGKTYFYRIYTFDKAYNYSSPTDGSIQTSQMAITSNANADNTFTLSTISGDTYLWTGGTTINTNQNIVKSNGTYFSTVTKLNCVARGSIDIILGPIAGLNYNGDVTTDITTQVSKNGFINVNNTIDVFGNIIDFRGGDGKTVNTAGISAKQILQDYPSSLDGTYWINLPVVGATQLFCIMNKLIDGGGWMLGIKSIAGSSNFDYFNSNWTNISTLGPTNTSRNNTTEAKFHVMNYFPTKDILVLFPDFTTTTSGGSINLSGITGYKCWNWLFNNFYNSGERIIPIDFFANHNNYKYGDGIPSNYSGFGSAFSAQSGYGFLGFNTVRYFNSPLNYLKIGTGAQRIGMTFSDDNTSAINAFGGVANYSSSPWGYSLNNSGDSYKSGATLSQTGKNSGSKVEIYVR